MKLEMKTHFNKEIKPELNGKKVTIAGWIHDKRELGSLIFVLLRDSTGIVQIAFNEKSDSDLFNQVKQLTLESVISVTGTVMKQPKSKLGVELIPEKIIIHSIVKDPFPLTLTGKAGVRTETKFLQRHLAVRLPEIVKIMEVKSEVLNQARNFLTSEGFVEIITPILAAAGTEGGADLFEVKYFNEKAYLAQSSQLYKQAAITMHEKVFDIMPCFRAEKSKTTKHLTEFWQIDFEQAFLSFEGVLEVEERLIHHIIKGVKEKCADQLEELNPKLKVPKLPFKRMTFKEAVDEARKLGFEESYNQDISTPAELALAAKYDELFFITHYPKEARWAFYALDPKDPNLTLSTDLLLPNFGELSSGGKREHDYELLLKKLKAQVNNIDNLQWYLDLFKYGIPPHSGAGFGVERLVRYICNLEHIREAVMFPRTPDLLRP